MSETEYNFVLVLLWLSFIAGALLARRVRAHGIVGFICFLLPATLVWASNYFGLLDFAPFNMPLPDFGKTWNIVTYNGFMIAVCVFIALRIMNAGTHKDKELDPR